jgi:hypothetical protein
MPQAQLDGWETAFRFSDDIAEESSSEFSHYAPYSDEPPRNSNRRGRRRAQRPMMASALRPSHALRTVTFDQSEPPEAYPSMPRTHASRKRPDASMDEAFLNSLVDKLSDRMMNYLRDPEVMRELLAQERQPMPKGPVGMAYSSLKEPLSVSSKRSSMPSGQSTSGRKADPMMVDAETLLEDNIMLARQVKRLQALLDERQDVINWLNAEYQGFRHVIGSMYLKV